MVAAHFATPEEAANKGLLLGYFRQRGQEALAELQREIGARNPDKLAGAINKALKNSIRQVTDAISSAASTGSWSPEQKLSALLAATYSGQVAMLELRNELRPYEYMDFSRRVGELWEDFIRLVFKHAPSKLGDFVPPLFSEVRTRLRQEITDYIDALTLSAAEKTELLAYYNKVWILVDSGEINLQLDLHCIVNGDRINIDLKSGFGSNEKGNTNRLLMVATIYKNLPGPYRNLLLVRAPEDATNNYFKTLKSSGVWEAFCGADAYAQIQSLTGFDIAAWIAQNISWKTDLSGSCMEHFQRTHLDAYLTW
jgi:hypothetical protein